MLLNFWEASTLAGGGGMDYVVNIYRLTYLFRIILWVLYSILFAYTMSKWKILRRSPKILIATILVYILCSAQTLLYFLAFGQEIILSIRILSSPDDTYTWVFGEHIAELWIVIGQSKFKGWIAVPIATSISSAGFGLINISTFVSNDINWEDGSIFFNAFLGLCTNFMVTAGLSYRIWSETRHDFASSMQNKTRLRQIAMGLIETGFIYFAAQLSFTVILAMAWYSEARFTFEDFMLSYTITNTLNAFIPGIATTLIAAKINITNIIYNREELITEVFAPWRSRSGPSNIHAYNAGDTTLKTFRAAVFLPFDEDTPRSSQALSVPGLNNEYLKSANDNKDSTHKVSPF